MRNAERFCVIVAELGFLAVRFLAAGFAEVVSIAWAKGACRFASRVDV
jgi:hypothetical protein